MARKRRIKRRTPRKKYKWKKVGSHKPTVKVPIRQIMRRIGSEKKNTKRSKLNRTTQRIFFEALRIGMTKQSAIKLAGLSASTLEEYMVKGNDPDQQKFVRFKKKVKKVEAEREKEALNVIRAAANGGIKVTKTKIKNGPKGIETERMETTLAPQWQAAAWFLERKQKVDWGRDAQTETERTPEEIARQIQEAQQILDMSIPAYPDESNIGV